MKESMEMLIFQAAQEGNVILLLNILKEDSLILDRIFVDCFPETPLHIASMLGHVSFVREIISRKPEFVREMNSKKFSPLHLASAGGFLDVVQALISVDPDMCHFVDKFGRNPLHLAAMKGRVDVLKELLQAQPYAARATLHQGETILHVCVKHNQFEAMKLLIETISNEELLNAQNDDGHTILHMAMADKQTQTINYLLQKTGVEMIDMDNLYEHSTQAMKKQENIKQQKEDWLEEARNTLMIVASLIATMAFQVGVNPPGGFYQETMYKNESGSINVVEYNAGDSVLSHRNSSGYGTFLMCNTIGFISSLSIILLLISGLPMIRRRVFVWILMVIMWLAITATAITYATSILLTTTSAWYKEKRIGDVIIGLLIVWVALIAFLILVHSIRFIIKIVKARTKIIELKDNDV